KTGGNAAFLTFIEDELKPLIEKKYPIDRRQQTLFGHSFGGHFALYVLFNRPGTFQNYIAASPSIWWNDRSILEDEKRFLEKQKENAVPARLLLAAGELEQSPARVEGESPRMADAAKSMADRLNAAHFKEFTCEFLEFPGEEHGSAVIPAAS